MSAHSLRAFAPAALAAGAAVALASSAAMAGGDERPVRGWLEHAHIEPSGISLDAKLDTGARTSSIHAEILRGPNLGRGDRPAEAVEEIPQDAEVAEATALAASPADGSDVEIIEDETDPEVEEIEIDDVAGDDGTIVFRITNEVGETSTLQRTVVRYVEIKNRDGTTQRRPVVEITACIAGVWVTGEVNLADREDFNYPFLVGRNMLESSGIVVDSREIYTRSARCPTPAP
jgi:hypothetical protein